MVFGEKKQELDSFSDNSTCLQRIPLMTLEDMQASQSSSDTSTAESVERYRLRKSERDRRKRLGNKFGYGEFLRQAYCSGGADASKAEEACAAVGLSVADVSVLGFGTFGKVFQATLKNDNLKAPFGTRVAIKCIRNSRSFETNIRGDQEPVDACIPRWVLRKVQILEMVEHPNLLRCYAYFVSRRPFIFVLELCSGGNLYDLLHRSQGSRVEEESLPRLSRFSWEQRTKVIVDIASGMEHLSAKNIMHRDLKSLNVLLVSRLTSLIDLPVAKVCDFGLARIMAQECHEHLTKGVGSSVYMAPEVFDICENDSREYTTKADVYSFGILIYEVITDLYPYRELGDTNGVKLVLHVSMGKRPSEAFVPAHAPEILTTTMRRAWSDDPSDRPSFDSILLELDHVVLETEDMEI